MKPKPQPKISSSSDSGFTIVESLMGIVVVAILMASIAPVLIMSTSIRVQSRRIEKATQAATTFINGIKTGSIEAPSETLELKGEITEASSLIDLNKMPVPGTKANTANLYFLKTNGTTCLVSNANCNTDSTNTFEEFYIQAAQIIGEDSDPITDGYRLAIRVYRGDVDFSKPLLASNGDVKTVESPIVSGIGNRQAPAVERTVEVANRNTSFQSLCSLLGMGKDKDGNAQTCK